MKYGTAINVLSRQKYKSILLDFNIIKINIEASDNKHELILFIGIIMNKNLN